MKKDNEVISSNLDDKDVDNFYEKGVFLDEKWR